MTVNAVSRCVRVPRNVDGKLYGTANLGTCGTYVASPAFPYLVYPISVDGLFSNDTIPNTSAKWRIVSADSPERWEWFHGGGYTFDAAGASAGTYAAVYEVQNWDGNGNDAQATVTVTVTA